MINFNLPYNTTYKKINQYLKCLPKKYFKADINFYCYSELLPYNYFRGGYNPNNNFTSLNAKNFAFNDVQTPICFNCANINLNEDNFYDNKLRILLDNNMNGANLIEVSNFELLKFLKEKYNNYYKYILSSEINLLKELSSEEINILLENNIFDYISLNQTQSINFNFLNQIKERKKIEILLNADCDMKCKNWKKCRIEQHEAIYNFSIKNSYKECLYQKSTIIPLEDIINKYIPLGFNHFKFSSLGYNEREYFIFLLNYFIKEEYKLEVYKKYYEHN